MARPRSFTQRFGLALLAGTGVLIAVGVVLWARPPAPPPNAPYMVMFKSPTCQCCVRWAAQLREAGFAVQAEHPPDLAAVRAQQGVAPAHAACHTALVGGYVVEGHVPVADIRRLLAERPKARGLVLPGMPIGSPGMEGLHPEAYDVLLLHDDGSTSVFAHHTADEWRKKR